MRSSISTTLAVGGRALCPLLFAAALASPAAADEFAYTYADLGYIHSDGANGGGLNGSVELGRHARLRAGGSFLTDSGVDLTSLGAGIDYIARINDTVNVLIGGGISYAKVDAGFFDADTTDANASVSVRFLAGPNFELEPGIGYVFGDFDDAVFGVEGRYWFNPSLAVQFGVSGSTADGSDAVFSLGVRFGPQYR